MTKSIKNLTPSKTINPDPLFVIFEQHLLNFQDDDMERSVFIKNVIGDYLSFLAKKSIAIPSQLKASVVEELSTLVNTMLLKKIYGCLSPQEYQKTALGDTKRKAKTRYNRLKTG